MSARFLNCDLNQPYLLPPSLQDWLPQDHLARFIAQVVDRLDLGKILSAYSRKDTRGKLGYHPALMVRLLLYGYAVGVRSSRKLEKATYDQVPFRYLAADQHPDHDSIADFRKTHLSALADLFFQALQLCQKAGLVKLGQVSIDGTKIMASASKQQSRSYERLSEKEKALALEVERLLKEAAACDQQEDELFGPGKRDEELPKELATAEKQLAKLRAAKEELEREAKEKAEQTRREKAEQAGKPRDEAQKKRWQRAGSETPEQDTRGNITDPESRRMVDGGSKAMVQGYNAQVAVTEQQIIVAQTVVNEENDRKQLAPMLDMVERNMGAAPEVTLADAGYWNSEMIAGQQAKKRDVLVPPDGPKTEKSGVLPANAPRNETARQMRQRLGEEKERKRYQKRCGTVEPVFGWIKELLGYRRFLLRGLDQVQGEWALICLTMNLKKLYRYGSPDRAWLKPLSTAEAA